MFTQRERETVRGKKHISKINMSGPEEGKLMICWTSVCNGCSATLPNCIQLSGPFSVLVFSGNQRRGATMNRDGRDDRRKWADTHTLGKSGVWTWSVNEFCASPPEGLPPGGQPRVLYNVESQNTHNTFFQLYLTTVWVFFVVFFELFLKLWRNR